VVVSRHVVQTLMLLARERGLETCAREAWASWHHEVTEFIGASQEVMLFCGLAMGYGDHATPVNRLRSDRSAIGDFATFTNKGLIRKSWCLQADNRGTTLTLLLRPLQSWVAASAGCGRSHHRGHGA